MPKLAAVLGAVEAEGPLNLEGHRPQDARREGLADHGKGQGVRASRERRLPDDIPQRKGKLHDDKEGVRAELLHVEDGPVPRLSLRPRDGLLCGVGEGHELLGGELEGQVVC